MTIPNLNSANNATLVPCLDLVPANQLAVEPICSWRLNDPQLELKVSRDRENIRYSVCNHFDKSYWPKSTYTPADLMSVFAHCVWKGVKKRIESRLFSDGQGAVCISVNSRTKKIGIKEWEDGALEDFLAKKNPIISGVNDDNSLEFQEETRETPRSRPYDPKAEEGMTRWRRSPKGELAIIGGEPVTEETMKVWPGPRDIRLIKFISKQREEILFRVFDWENKKNLEVPSRFASCASSNLPKINRNIDTVIQKIHEYTPELENVKNEEVITIYREHPLNYFMPEYADLSRTKASEVQIWVYEQFYRKEGEREERFEYTNFVSAKKIAFSFGKKKQQNALKNAPEVEAWHVEMKRQAAWALQFPIGISNFFSGIFSITAQNPNIVDKDAMERFVQGVPLLDPERNKIADDFALELGACSIINFYISCDRSVSQLEINGRAWVRSFANAGRDVRGAVVHGAEGLVHIFGRVDLAQANLAVRNVADFVEGADRLRQGLRVFRGVPPPQNNPENG